ncbi:28S ribosomal protein S2, mitochondrial-like [Argonauta hians]
MTSMFRKTIYFCPKKLFQQTLTKHGCGINNGKCLLSKNFLPFLVRFSSSAFQVKSLQEPHFSPEKLEERDNVMYLELPVPTESEDYFGVDSLVDLRTLFSHRVHLGHKKGLRDRHMAPYIYGTRLGIDIIDLECTLPLLRRALNFTAHVAYQRGVVLFMSRNLQMLPEIERTALECGEYANCRPWGGGIFTNPKVMFGAVTRLPDLVILFGTLDNAFCQHTAVRDAAKVCVPTVGVCDTNADPRLITYPVPGNDDSPDSMRLFLRIFKAAIMRGKEKRREDERLLLHNHMADR